MKYIIDIQSKEPRYLQLYRQIRDDIISLVYPFNSKLPSKRLVAEELKVSTITVEHAYALLCEEGYIEPKERSGYFVAFRQSDGFLAVGDRDNTQLPTAHYSVFNKTKFPFSVLSKTMRKVISDYGEMILERSSNSGTRELREAIKQYLLRSRGISTDIDQIIIGSGAEYLYGLIVELLGRNLVYGMESPSYKKIKQVYSACDVKYEMLPLESDGIDSNALRCTKADVLHITPYRSYPSGVTATASKRYEYLRWAETKGRYIIEDDFESEFSVSKKVEETLYSHSNKDNVIYVNTFSMTVSPSLRVGYMVLPKSLVPQFNEKLGFYSCTVPTFEQLVLSQLLSNGDFERHINRVRRQNRKELLK